MTSNGKAHVTGHEFAWQVRSSDQVPWPNMTESVLNVDRGGVHPFISDTYF
jgi:hypothetical protein